MTWLKRTLAAAAVLGVLAGALLAAAWWLLASEVGTAWLADRLLARAAPTLTVRRVSGSLRDGVILEGVAFRLPQDELDIARLALDWDGKAALAGTLAFHRADASGVAYRRIGGEAASGPVPELPFPVRVELASVVSLDVTVGDRTVAFGATRFAAGLTGHRLRLDGVTTGTSGFALTGDGDVVLDDGVTLDVTIGWSGPVAGVSSVGRATLTGRWPAVAVRSELDAPFPARAEGRLDFTASSPRFDLAIDYRDLEWPGVDVVASPSGRLRLTGTVEAYRYDGSGEAVVRGERAAGFSILGTGTPDGLALERVEVAPRIADAPAGRVVASGELGFASRETALALTASDFDPGWFDPVWPGRVTGTAALDARLVPEVAAQLTTIDVAGELRGAALGARGGATFTAPDRWRLDALELRSHDDVLTATGTLDGSSVALDWRAEVDDLGAFLESASGGGTAQGRIEGPWQSPRFRGDVTLEGLTLAGFSAARVEARGEAGLAADAPLALTFEATELSRGELTIDHAHAEASGTTAAQRIALEAQAAEWRAEATLSGGFAAPRWHGSIDALEFDELVLGPWRLEAPAALALGAGHAELATSCLLHASGGRWCAALTVDGRPTDRLVISAQNFSLKTLRPLLSPALTVDGVYQLSASLLDLTGEPHGALAVTGGLTKFRVAFGEAQAFATDLDDVLFGATLEEGKLDLTARVRSATAGQADLDASIGDIRRRDSEITGELNAQWPDLSFLALLSPDVDRVAGAISADLRVAGTIENPSLEGEARWTGGRVAVPAWGLLVEDIEGTARGNDTRSLEFSATGRAGDGQLTLTGTTTLADAEAWRARLELRGEGVRAVQLPGTEIVADPDLDVDVALPAIRVTGAVLVPHASVELDALPEQAVTPSPDVVLHGEAVPEAYRPLALTAAIDLTLGDDVHYAGLNLDTKVTGQLRLERAANRSASAVGGLTLDGTYNAYGQKLALERGELIFAGPLDDPGLDVRAVREVDTTRVGVELTGTLKAPQTRIFSSPAMSEADALSYLLLGRPMTGTGTEETATLQTAAIAMGLQQALPVVQRIGTSLGLDELTVQTTATDAGALMAGKYLSPKVYIRYSYGLFNRIGGLLLRFKVNERLSIETRSGDQKSMDLLYTVEKD